MSLETQLANLFEFNILSKEIYQIFSSVVKETKRIGPFLEIKIKL